MTDHTIATALVKAQKAHKRKDADFYPTPTDVTVALLDFLDLDGQKSMWEPACGDGAMARVLEHYGHTVAATDLREEPSIYGEGGVDFLQYDLDPENGIPLSAVFNDWIITNPPFNLAEAFIRKSLQITPNVAMLLNSSYWHAATRKGLFEEHPPAYVLPLLWRPAFLEAERGKSPMMNVIWVVWKEGERDTRFRLLPRPKDVPTLQRHSTKSNPDNIEAANDDFEDLL